MLPLRSWSDVRSLAESSSFFSSGLAPLDGVVEGGGGIGVLGAGRHVQQRSQARPKTQVLLRRCRGDFRCVLDLLLLLLLLLVSRAEGGVPFPRVLLCPCPPARVGRGSFSATLRTPPLPPPCFRFTCREGASGWWPSRFQGTSRTSGRSSTSPGFPEFRVLRSARGSDGAKEGGELRACLSMRCSLSLIHI